MTSPKLLISRERLSLDLADSQTHRFLGEDENELLIPDNPDTALGLLNQVFTSYQEIYTKTGSYPSILYSPNRSTSRIINPNDLRKESLGYLTQPLPNTAEGILELARQKNQIETPIFGAENPERIIHPTEEDIIRIQKTLETLFN